MKILHIVPSLGPRFGGPTVTAIEEAQALQRRGVNVRLLTTDLDEDGTFLPFRSPRVISVSERRSLANLHLDIGWHGTVWPSRLQIAPGMLSELSQTVTSYEAVHIHSLFSPVCFLAAAIARRHHVPYIWRLHGTLDPHLRRQHRGRKRMFDMFIGRRLLEAAAAIHCTSPAEAQWIRDSGYTSRVVIVPPGVDITEFAHLPRGEFRRANRLPAEAILVVFMGRIAEKKGVDLLLRGFGRIRDDFPEAWLVLAGPEDEEGYSKHIRQLIDELDLGGRVLMPGMVRGDQKKALLGDADVWALTSYGENFGIAVLEALAAGLPVLITDKVGLASSVRAGEAGLIVECDPGAIASGLAALLGQRALADRLRRNAKALASDFSWDLCADRLRGVYESISGLNSQQ